jgi:hypothetical protein
MNVRGVIWMEIHTLSVGTLILFLLSKLNQWITSQHELSQSTMILQ